jgi:uncharacterized protein YndB with AHSA1/START domain
MEANPGRIHVEIAVFEDLGDRTGFTNTLIFDTTEERDAVVKSGMEAGVQQTYKRLDGLLSRPAA